jgi:hypothetical protein
MTTGAIAEEDETLIERAKAKCERGEIDAELRDMIARMKEIGMSPALCDGCGNAIRPGMPRQPGFTLRVGTLTMRNP